MHALPDTKDKFDWDRYLESQELESAPNFAFHHIDKCQQSLLEVGMMVEVQTSQRPRFWLANVTMKCGPFLRLKHVGREDPTHEIWTDPSSVEIHPVGYSSSRGWPLEPPADLKPLRSGAIASLLEEHKAVDCEASLLSPAQQMKPGMILEVEDLHEPRTVWPATIVRNVGGRLLLKYAFPTSIPIHNNEEDVHHEWLFCLSPRLHWQGWAVSQSTSWNYNPPIKIRPLIQDDNLATMSAEFRTVSGKQWQFDQHVPSHGCNVGDRIEAIDPLNPLALRPATVIEVVDPQRVVIRFDLESNAQETEAPLQFVCSTVFRPETDDSCPSNDVENESGFTRGVALEAANPWKPAEVCVGVVTNVERSATLLRIRLEKSVSDDGHPTEFLAPVSSQDVFPIGWCDDNSWPLVTPPVAPPSSSEQPPMHSEGNPMEVEEKGPEPNATEQIPEAVEPSAAGTAALPGISYWCPKIYFNFRCFTGPLLSRIRVAALPRSVGPGPISLMMKEVLSLLLNGAYKPGSVLKQLQGEPADPLPPGTQLEPLKAKYRQTTYRGTVPMASTAADVPEYCRWVCGKLQCCPYLFAPELVGDPCPHRCCILAKTVWQHKKKAPNWRHRRFVDIIKSLPTGLDPVGAAELQQHGSSNKSGPASLAAIESGEHSDDEDSDAAVDPSQQQQQPQPPQQSVDLEEPAAKKRRGRPRKNPIPLVSLDHANADEDGRPSQISHPPQIVVESTSEKPLPSMDFPAFRRLDLADPPPDRWRAGDVWRFLQSTDCRPLADRLLQYEVDGPSLLLLQPADIMDYVTLNWELALRLCYLIGCLRLTYSSGPSPPPKTLTAIDAGASNDTAKSPAPKTAQRAS
ncbi:Scm with four MBT domains 1-like protein [Daphnia magna]|uniref:Scm with four MBT domains 1-like protein n=1 Tax=Daphnia magna TaxID=35525 RepID=A0A0P5V315_9CRUS|nr:Scm with four MBT domains 1-like protein [Daphnia magna]